jgi:hypothetical protein
MLAIHRNIISQFSNITGIPISNNASCFCIARNEAKNIIANTNNNPISITMLLLLLINENDMSSYLKLLEIYLSSTPATFLGQLLNEHAFWVRSHVNNTIFLESTIIL